MCIRDSYIEDEGFLRFTGIGGVSKMPALHSSVIFPDGTVGIVSAGDKVKEKELKLQEMFIDIGGNSREEAEKLVPIGTSGVFCGRCV